MECKVKLCSWTSNNQGSRVFIRITGKFTFNFENYHLYSQWIFQCNRNGTIFTSWIRWRNDAPRETNSLAHYFPSCVWLWKEKSSLCPFLCLIISFNLKPCWFTFMSHKLARKMIKRFHYLHKGKLPRGTREKLINEQT